MGVVQSDTHVERTETGIAPSRTRQRGIWRRMSPRMWRRTVTFYTFVAPWVLGFLFLGFLPLVLGFYLSLTNYDGLNWGTWKIMGLQNYSRAFGDEKVRQAFIQTLKYSALNIPAWVGLSFILALILNQDVKGRGFFRTLYYLPSVVPIVATVWIWKIFLDKNYGLLNALLSLFRPGTSIAWLSTQALFGLTCIAVWSGLGWGMVVFLAGLQDIPEELIEAARIDGANTWQVFRNVTVPLMTPMIFFVLLTGVIGSFQQFQLPLLLGVGSEQMDKPPIAVRFYMLNVYYESFEKQRYAYGIALVWFLFIVIMALSVLLFWSQRYWVYTEEES